MNVKQIPSHVRSLEPHIWAKLTILGICMNVKQIPSHVKSRTTHLGKINNPWHLYEC